MTRITSTPAQHSRASQYTPTAPVPQVHHSPARKEAHRKSLAPSRPVLWFLFLFNLAVAVAAGAAGNHLHVHGHTVHGAQIAAGMGVVALGAGAALFFQRGQRA
jgi:4-hydroxybenzoate polyprenyltransferase